MDFNLSQEHLMLRDLYRKFAENEVKPLAEEVDEEERFPMETVKKLARYGFMGIPFPTKYGGAGGDILAYAMAVEELSKCCATTGVIVSAHTSLCCAPIFENGTEEQKMKYLPALLSGEKIGAFGLTEPGAGTDAAGQQTTAVLEGDHYVLNGTKTFITNGSIASIYVIFAKTDPEARGHGITAFLVDRDTPGLSAGAHENKMGFRLSDTTEVIMDNVRVPKSAVIGQPGEGMSIALNALNLSRAFISTLGVGIMQRALDEAVAYAQQRKQFGKRLIDFQMVQSLLADMAIKTEASRVMVNNCMRLMDKGDLVRGEGAIVKTFVTDSMQEVTSNAVQVFGGYGFSKDYPVEKLMRDSKVFQIFEGTNQIQRMTIAKNLDAEYRQG